MESPPKKLARINPPRKQPRGFSRYQEKLWVRIFRFVKVNTLVELAKINVRFYELVNQDQMWREIFIFHTRIMEKANIPQRLTYSWEELYKATFRDLYLTVNEPGLVPSFPVGFLLTSDRALLTKNVEEPMTARNDAEIQELSNRNGNFIAENIKAGLWMAFALNGLCDCFKDGCELTAILEARHVELPLYPYFLANNWKFEKMGKVEYDEEPKNVDAAIFDLASLRDRSTTDLMNSEAATWTQGDSLKSGERSKAMITSFHGIRDPNDQLVGLRIEFHCSHEDCPHYHVEKPDSPYWFDN